MSWYIEVIRKYTVFKGRAGRKEYWMFSLIHFLIIIMLCVLMVLNENFAFLIVLYYVFSFLPNITVTVRRLHDVGRSGAWYFITFIPFGGFVLLVLTVLESQPRENAYGPEPDLKRIAS